jgi:hypothetical protein
LKISEKPL